MGSCINQDSFKNRQNPEEPYDRTEDEIFDFHTNKLMTSIGKDAKNNILSTTSAN